MKTIYEYLYDSIFAACPSEAIATIRTKTLNGETCIEVVYYDHATAEQRAAGDAAAAAFDWNARQAKIDAFDAAISAGFLVEPEGFTLGLDDASRLAFDQTRNQLREGIDLGLLTNEATCPVPLRDVDDVPHTLTVGRVRQIIFAGGNYYAALLAASR